MSTPNLQHPSVTMGNSHNLNAGTPRRKGDGLVENPKGNDLIVAIMGPTGSGKSTFINALIGREVASVGDDLESHTAQIGHFAFFDSNFPDRRIIVIDTPGLDDIRTDDREILGRISAWLTRSYGAKTKLAGVVYLHDIHHDQMHVTRKELSMIEGLCGLEGVMKVVLATTMWGDVTPEAGIRREHILRAKYWKYMLDRGSTMARFDGTQRSAQDIVNSVLARSKRSATLDQPPAPRITMFRRIMRFWGA